MIDRALPTLRFTADDQQRAYEEWGSNCGPGAIAAVLGMTLDELRPSLGDFEQKRYTNPSLMWSILDRLVVPWRLELLAVKWPAFGLARIQWEGPWTANGVPARVAYRHTHWVAASTRPDGRVAVFDINAAASGWISAVDWAEQLVPWLLQECEPKADGRWHFTHIVEIGEHV